MPPPREKRRRALRRPRVRAAESERARKEDASRPTLDFGPL